MSKMHNWQKGIFTNAKALNPNALYTAKFVGAEELESDSVSKVRFSYIIVDANGEQHDLNRSFSTKDKQSIKKWLQSHTNFNASDLEMREIQDAKHLAEISYYKEYSFIQRVFPLDGDLHVHA